MTLRFSISPLVNGNKFHFDRLFNKEFFAFLLLLLVISLFKMALNVVLRCSLVFLSARRLGWASGRKYCTAHPGISYNAVFSEFDVNESKVYIRYGIFKETQNKLCLDWLTKM